MLKELSFQEMSEIKGGISVEEYCKGLLRLAKDNMQAWSEEEVDNFSYAYTTHCIK